MCSGAEQEKEKEPQRFGYCAQLASVFGGTQDAKMAGTKMRGSAALHGNEVQANRKAGPQAVFR